MTNRIKQQLKELSVSNSLLSRRNHLSRFMNF